ncbi:MAG: toxin-antitoxin system HicB family antitoxin [Candidatus Aminicenantales bacterium]
MSQNSDRYTFRITWSEDDGEFVGLCLEFPSLSWLAKSPEAALKGIRREVKRTVQDMENNGESPPPPISGRSFSGKFVVRIPPEVHRALAIKAAEEGISLNRLVNSKLAGEIR